MEKESGKGKEKIMYRVIQRIVEIGARSRQGKEGQE